MFRFTISELVMYKNLVYQLQVFSSTMKIWVDRPYGYSSSHSIIIAHKNMR